MTVKTRKQGNSIMITIPASFNIGENVEYEPILNKDGVISLMPVRRNLYDYASSKNLRSAIDRDNNGDNGTLIGKEDVWHDE